MQTSFFNTESKRLISHFGAENFTAEKLKLIWLEVRDLGDSDFKIIVDVCIGEYQVKYPPRISDVRELAMQRRKIMHRRAAEAAAKKWKPPVEGRETSQPIKDPLRKFYNQVDNTAAKNLLDSILKKRGPSEKK